MSNKTVTREDLERARLNAVKATCFNHAIIDAIKRAKEYGVPRGHIANFLHDMVLEVALDPNK
jgi:hypothetical protein